MNPPQLRIWPGAALVAILWLLRFVVPAVEPEATPVGVLGVFGGSLAILVWWTFFSRASWTERGIVLGALAFVSAATVPFLHESVATGAAGLLFPVFALPGLCLVLVVWAFLNRNRAAGRHYATLVIGLAVASGSWALVRTGGFDSRLDQDFAWRWQPTAEERMLAAEETRAPQAPERTPGDASVELPASPPEWPGFRGPLRNGVATGAALATAWNATPPELLWRRPIGPGWSSFAVQGDRAYTQEQRGDHEVVACYDLATGEPVWRHGDPIRFWEANAGAGPRATPAIAEGRVFALGATGVLNALAAADGTVLWSRDAQADSGASRPEWGFSGSPLVVADQVIVATAGALAAYDVATGTPRWSGPTSGDGYSSPQLVTIDGLEQLVFLSADRATGIDLETGAELWMHAWSGAAISQPAELEGGDLLISLGDRSGVRRLGVSRQADGWSVSERWTSARLKPYFNDFVVAGDQVYGFDGGILACIDLGDGARRWKGGRYGRGQIVLSAATGAILVLSETGELALVEATPDEFRELALVPALEGKTWNHPVLVEDLLLVRNAQEMAAFRLPRADEPN